MRTTLSPSKFMLIRQDTHRSSVPSEMSQSRHLPNLQSQSSHKNNLLLSKTLKFINQSHDLVSFSKKIFVPKVRRNTFLQQIDKKKQAQRVQNLLLSRRKQTFQQGSFKNTIDQDSRGESGQNRHGKEYNSSLKSKMKKRSKNFLKQASVSLSKIQMLSGIQRQQTIAQENYDNENYIFLNLKKAGDSESVKEEQPFLYPSQVPFQPKLRYQKSYVLEMPSNSMIRPKVKSMSKYDRQRQQSMDKSMNYRRVTDPKVNPFRGMNQTTRNGQISQFIKLFPIVPNTSTDAKQNADNHDVGNIIASLKLILIGPQSTITTSKMQRMVSKSAIKDEQLFAMQLKRITSYYQKSTSQLQQTQQCLYILLSGISKDRNKDTIRIYKDDFAKIYTFRYGKDKITSFFDYEYIQDYGSLLGLFTENILQFNSEQVLLMSFMMMDFDNDGLISHSDLFKLLTILDKNLLVKKTIYTVLKYVKDSANNEAIRDVCQEDYLKKESFTLKKYQFMMYMKDKKKTDGQEGAIDNSPKGSLIKSSEGKPLQRKSTSRRQHICPLRSRYFSIKNDKQQNTRQFQFLKSFIDNMARGSQPGADHFWINFQRFKSLYPSSIPQVYYDMLYAAFGLKIPGMEYDELDYETPLVKPKKYVHTQVVKRMDVIKENIGKMRATRTDLNSKLIRPDIKRHRKINSMLD